MKKILKEFSIYLLMFIGESFLFGLFIKNIIESLMTAFGSPASYSYFAYVGIVISFSILKSICFPSKTEKDKSTLSDNIASRLAIDTVVSLFFGLFMLVSLAWRY